MRHNGPHGSHVVHGTYIWKLWSGIRMCVSCSVPRFAYYREKVLVIHHVLFVSQEANRPLIILFLSS